MSQSHPFKAYEEISDDLGAVERKLREVLQSDVPLVTEVTQHPARGGGKRLRPALVLLGGRFYRPEERERLIGLATSAELIHMATLVHDDIVDRADKRRGRDTVNARWGDRMAVLAGDYLLGSALALVAEWGTQEVISSLSRCVQEMAKSEMRQFGGVNRLATTEADYLDWIEKKTALLMAESAQLGAMGSGAPPEIVGPLWAFGRAVGLCFQIVDDLLDLTAPPDRLGKPAGGDIRNGVSTLPIIHALAESSERARLKAILLDGQGSDDLEEVVDILRRSGSFEYAFGRASSFAAVARHELDKLPTIPARQALSDMVDSLLYRTH